MNRKQFAALCVAKEQALEIQTILADLNNEDSYHSCQQIQQIQKLVDKYIEDFGDVDPGWTPAKAAAQR